MATRIIVLIVCFVSASAYIGKASKTEFVIARESLAEVPMRLNAWEGLNIGIDDRVLAVLGVDDYLNRVYVTESGSSLGLYVGFYETQRQGSTIHSPLNCLPGAGWNPVDRSYLSIPVAPNNDIRINRIVIEKGMERQIAFYWYQAHGRVVASEYWGKIYTVLDAMRLNRTDGALVRVISPVVGSGAQAEQMAERVGVTFIQSIVPVLSRYLPE